MNAGSHLRSLLQFQLASDASAVKYLPYTVSTLTAEALSPSPHLAKWTIRIHSLLHSKEPGARWAGLCLSYKTSLLARNIMIECAQSWMGIVLPVLSRNEPLPILKAALRLLRVIFSTATHVTEFNRHVAVPNVVKVTSAVIVVADGHTDTEIKILAMETLTLLVSLYPTTHRASSSSLSAFALRYLSGSSTSRTSLDIMNAASDLYSILPLTGGKVGAVNLWRKSLDETIAFGWDAFASLRTTFPPQGHNSPQQATGEEPQTAIPLNLDRLRCCVVTLRNLTSTLVQRPVQVPLGSLVNFGIALLSCSRDGMTDGFVDPLIRSMEVAAVPEICSLGCELVACLAERFPYRLNPHSTRLVTILSFQLEQKSEVQLKLLIALKSLLKSCHPISSGVLSTRVAKTILPLVTRILSTSATRPPDSNDASSGKSKNAKKRAGNFEGDEVFKAKSQAVCATAEDGQVLLTSISILEDLFRNESLSFAIQSVIARIIIAVLVALPRMTPSSLSPDPNFMVLLTKRVEEFSFTIGSGTTSTMSQLLPIIVEGALTSGRTDLQHKLEALLHPNIPPLVRTMPHLESLSLFKAEESHEESELLSSMSLQKMHYQEPEEDVAMGDATLGSSPNPTLVTSRTQTTSTQKEGPVQPTRTLLQPVSTQSKPNVELLPPQAKVLNAADIFPSIRAGPTDPDPDRSSAKSTLVPPSTTGVIAQQDESGDEEMPVIDMESDSEIDED